MPEVKKKILFDRYRGIRAGFYTHDTWGSLRYLASILKKRGIECYDLNMDKGPITYEMLKEYDALWIHGFFRKIPLLESEIQEIKTFVWERNGGLLLMYDFPDYFKYSSPLSFLGNVFDLYPFHNQWTYDEDNDGMLYPQPQVIDDVSGLEDTGGFIFEDHTLTKEIKKLYSPIGFSPINVRDSAKTLISFRGEFRIVHYPLGEPEKQKTVFQEIGIYPIFAINKHYRVAAMCVDPIMFDDSSIKEYDNEEFAKRLFPWLCGVKEEIPEPKERISSFRYIPPKR